MMKSPKYQYNRFFLINQLQLNINDLMREQVSYDIRKKATTKLEHTFSVFTPLYFLIKKAIKNEIV